MGSTLLVGFGVSNRDMILNPFELPLAVRRHAGAFAQRARPDGAGLILIFKMLNHVIGRVLPRVARRTSVLGDRTP
jgi:hypothetical protein